MIIFPCILHQILKGFRLIELSLNSTNQHIFDSLHDLIRLNVVSQNQVVVLNLLHGTFPFLLFSEVSIQIRLALLHHQPLPDSSRDSMEIWSRTFDGLSGSYNKIFRPPFPTFGSILVGKSTVYTNYSWPPPSVSIVEEKFGSDTPISPYLGRQSKALGIVLCNVIPLKPPFRQILSPVLRSLKELPSQSTHLTPSAEIPDNGRGS